MPAKLIYPPRHRAKDRAHFCLALEIFGINGKSRVGRRKFRKLVAECSQLQAKQYQKNGRKPEYDPNWAVPSHLVVEVLQRRMAANERKNWHRLYGAENTYYYNGNFPPYSVTTKFTSSYHPGDLEKQEKRKVVTHLLLQSAGGTTFLPEELRLARQYIHKGEDYPGVPWGAVWWALLPYRWPQAFAKLVHEFTLDPLT